MSAYDFSINENILLVGEGNFSFSKELIKHIRQKENVSKFPKVYSTCYETEIHSSEMKNNLDLLEDSGLQVILGVDATKFSEHPVLKGLKFNRIIFNFPHVGGKMKIHLNRTLLKEFFISTSDILSDGGNVIVALCAGQGGTGYDVVERRWEDSWQIVEQAAYADYVLFKTEMFPHDYFPHYLSYGYRGGQKSFHTESAVVHIFRKTLPLASKLDVEDPEFYLNYQNHPDHMLRCPVLYLKKILENPLADESSPQNFLLKTLQGIVIKDSEFTCLEAPYYCDWLPSHVDCEINSLKKSLCNSLLEVLPVSKVKEHLIYKGLVFNKVSNDFTCAPASCHLAVVGSKSIYFCKQFIRDLTILFNLGDIWVWEEKNDVIELTSNNIPVITCYKKTEVDENFIPIINLDFLCIVVFRLESWKQLWVKGVVLKTSQPKLQLPSLFPPKFSFDICFSDSPSFTEDKFYCLLWEIGESVIDSVHLLSVYEPPGKTEKCYCYRIHYKSYIWPLYRTRVINYHQNVLGKALALVLKVNVS